MELARGSITRWSTSNSRQAASFVCFDVVGSIAKQIKASPPPIVFAARMD